MSDVDGLDEMRSYLTPREENEAMASYQNTTAIACPVCDDPFDYLVVCKHDRTTLSLDTVMSLCVARREEGGPFLFSHE